MILNGQTSFPQKLLLTDRQVSKLANMKLPKIHLSETVQSGEFLVRLLAPLMKNILNCSLKAF